MNIDTTKILLRKRANELGFQLFGTADVSDAALLPHLGRYEEWLAQGHHASMDYLKRHSAKKADPTSLLPGAKSVVMVGAVYSDLTRPASGVSNYAQSQDYHLVLREKLEALSVLVPRSYIFVDAQPVFERFWAWRAGLGWIGKNTCAIDKKAGSYFFIGGFLTDLEFEPDQPATDHCGRCTKCIDACPTQALIAPRVLDANLCIAYHTIENRGEIPVEVATQMGGLIAGCDICQQVCPWNDPPQQTIFFTQENAFAKVIRHKETENQLEDLKDMTPQEYSQLVKGTALERMKFQQFQRNLSAGKNQGH